MEIFSGHVKCPCDSLDVRCKILADKAIGCDKFPTKYVKIFLDWANLYL